MSNLQLELKGKISIIELDDNGKVISQEELPGTLALRVLAQAISDAVELLAEDSEFLAKFSQECANHGLEKEDSPKEKESDNK